MDNRRIRTGPGINARFAKAIEREEAKAAASEQARKKELALSDTVVDGMFFISRGCGGGVLMKWREREADGFLTSSAESRHGYLQVEVG
jgi:hypothetical protein